MSSILILGATGLVGQQLLTLALGDEKIHRVIAPTRRPLAIVHPKLDNPIVQFAQLPLDAPWWRVDSVFCALGSTMKQAGSKSAFYTIDHDFVLAAAKLARAAGARHFALNSSLGAKVDAGSFYLRVKGEVERDLIALNFETLVIVRPSFLDGGERPEKRLGEALAIKVSKWLGRLIPLRLRPIPTTKVAAAMLQFGLLPQQGVVVLESDQLQQAQR